MEQNKSCITINCGCCGNQTGSERLADLKYAQITADDISLTTGQKIYFNDKSFGNLEITPQGTIVLQPGIYIMFLNGQVLTSSSYLALNYYDLISGKYWGHGSSRVSANSGSNLSSSEGLCIVKNEQKVELCIEASYTESKTISAEDIYGSIIQIAELPTEEINK